MPVEPPPEPTLFAAVFRPYAVDVPYSKYAVVACPFDAGFVVTAGAAVVTKVLSAPRLVPASLVATTRKWYVFPVASPVTAAETAISDVPAPASFTGVFVP